MTPAATIAFKDVSKVYDDGRVRALDGVSLSVREREFLAIVGPSGSGKTTLLRIIAGLEIAEAGQVFFGGEDATRLSVQRRGIGFVFQHYALFKHLTVSDNIAYGLRVRPLVALAGGGQPVDDRRAGDGAAVAAERVVALLVRRDEEDLPSPATRGSRRVRIRRGRHVLAPAGRCNWNLFVSPS